jgi:DNA-binding transcriptional regulator LsrR (DeoR family)
MTVPQETLIHAVVLLHERGRSQREIATGLGISRGKVRRILERAHNLKGEHKG